MLWPLKVALSTSSGRAIRLPSSMLFATMYVYLPISLHSPLISPSPFQYVNGSTFYSPNLQQIAAGAYPSPQTVYSAGGQPFTFISNQTGLFVSNGNGTEARVVRPDVLVRNGVIHIIDHILVNTNSEPSAASSAYVSRHLMTIFLVLTAA